jgi:hypothetical protein
MDNVHEKGQNHILAILAARVGRKCTDTQKYGLTGGYQNGKSFSLK